MMPSSRGSMPKASASGGSVTSSTRNSMMGDSGVGKPEKPVFMSHGSDVKTIAHGDDNHLTNVTRKQERDKFFDVQ